MYNKPILIVLLFLSFQTSKSFSQDIPKKPKQERLINDFANIFSPAEEQQLEKKLLDFENSTSTQIVVVSVTTLNGYDKAKFTYSIGEEWKVGQKGFDNGVVIMVKPKEIDGRGETFIATGYGLEGVIPDAIAKRIVEQEMLPYFKQKNYYKGVDAATKTLMGLAIGEFTAKEYQKKTSKAKNTPAIPFSFLLLILFFFIIPLFRTVSKARASSIGRDVSFWAVLWLLMASNRSHSGHYSSFSSGGGSFGSSGGFGGFGGGSFGGGGAGGSW